ncbi:MAG: signal peptidase I [Ruminococcus sp.]|nr:signal peptidase I [Ruminococcus sp.]
MAVKVLKRIGQCALWVIPILLVGLSAYIMICNMQGRAAVVFGRSIVKVVSGSMEPSIHDGDYIIIKKTDSSLLKEGDIICFYSTDDEIYGKMNTHRIVRRLDDGSFVTKGDTSFSEDGNAVTADKIVGKYVGKVRFLRWLNSFASVKKLILAAVVVIMSATSVFEVVTIAKVSAECREKKNSSEEAIRQAIDREKQKLYEQKEREDN